MAWPIAAIAETTAKPTPLVLEKKIALGAVSGRIDHLAVDLQRRRLFVAELGNGSIGVIDLTADRVPHGLHGFQPHPVRGLRCSSLNWIAFMSRPGPAGASRRQSGYSARCHERGALDQRRPRCPRTRLPYPEAAKRRHGRKCRADRRQRPAMPIAVARPQSSPPHPTGGLSTVGRTNSIVAGVEAGTPSDGPSKLCTSR